MPLLKTGILAAHYKNYINFTKIPGLWLPLRLALFLLVEHFRNQDMVGLCYPTALKNTFVGLKGYMTKNNTCPLLPYCARSLKMFEGACKKITGDGLAAGCQLLYRAIYTVTNP